MRAGKQSKTHDRKKTIFYGFLSAVFYEMMDGDCNPIVECVEESNNNLESTSSLTSH